MGFKLIIGVGAGIALAAGTPIRVNTYRYKLKSYCVYWATAGATGPGLNFYGNVVGVYDKALVFRNASSISSAAPKSRVIVLFEGNFNFDSFSLEIPTEFTGRVEVRNDENVLIIDNGMPWGDGTYPADAKKRAGLAGLHAAPIASNNEFADLSGLDPNKEVEMIGAERGAGVQYALERDEDNGL